MSTYRKRTQPKPTTAAGLRAQASASGNSIFRNRPRSIAGLFGNNQNSYSSLLGGSSYSSSSSSSPSYLNKSSPTSSSGAYKNAYSNSSGSLNSYQNPYTTYGGTSSGYGALTLPSSSHSSIGSLNLATPSTSYGYLNGIGSRSSPSVHRAGSFNKPKAKIDSGSFGSRSSSLQSLAGSEGYVVRDFVLSASRLFD